MQHTCHLAQSLLFMCKITDTEADRYGIKLTLGIGQLLSIGNPQLDSFTQSSTSHLSTSHLDHLGRNISTCNLHVLNAFGNSDRQIARSRRKI